MQDISTEDAVDYGLMVMHAMDLYNAQDCPPHDVTPPAPPVGGQILAWIMGTDTILPGHPRYVPGPLQTFASQVCYGYVARRNGEIVVAIRGTNGTVEWVEDAQFLTQNYADDGSTAEQGFFGIFNSFTVVDMQRRLLGTPAEAIPRIVNLNERVTVTGHSLGAPLATYTALALAMGDLRGRVRGCFFASPHPGNKAFGSLLERYVTEYTVFNYVLDIVPRVPLAEQLQGYQSLPRVSYLQPGTARADIKLSAGCNHHIVCYCAMLDFDRAMKYLIPAPKGEETCVPCIKGRADGSVTLAMSLVDRIASVLPH